LANWVHAIAPKPQKSPFANNFWQMARRFNFCARPSSQL
jgi:hypothetical protein